MIERQTNSGRLSVGYTVQNNEKREKKMVRKEHRELKYSETDRDRDWEKDTERETHRQTLYSLEDRQTSRQADRQ